jgi:hypothetical protein
MNKTLLLFVLLLIMLVTFKAMAQALNGVPDTMNYVRETKKSFNINPFYLCFGLGGAPIVNLMAIRGWTTDPQFSPKDMAPGIAGGWVVSLT